MRYIEKPKVTTLHIHLGFGPESEAGSKSLKYNSQKTEKKDGATSQRLLFVALRIILGLIYDKKEDQELIGELLNDSNPDKKFESKIPPLHARSSSEFRSFYHNEIDDTGFERLESRFARSTIDFVIAVWNHGEYITSDSTAGLKTATLITRLATVIAIKKRFSELCFNPEYRSHSELIACLEKYNNKNSQDLRPQIRYSLTESDFLNGYARDLLGLLRFKEFYNALKLLDRIYTSNKQKRRLIGNNPEFALVTGSQIKKFITVVNHLAKQIESEDFQPKPGQYISDYHEINMLDNLC